MAVKDTPGATADHTNLSDQWIEVFRAGNYGEKGNYTLADLDHIVASYKPESHEAPAVIGHPETNSPAYGWVDGVKREGPTLLVHLDQVNPEFGDMVKSGAFKKRSASFYRKPEGPELRHVGFLGAQPPSVKGLSNIQFEDVEAAEVVFEEGSMAEQKTVREEIQSFFEGLFKKKDAANFSETDLQPLLEKVAAPLTAKITELETKLTQQSTSFAERERKIATSETGQRATDAIAKLRTAGRWLPAFEKMGLPLVFAELAKQTDVVEFGEGDKKQKLPPLGVLVNFLEKLPKFAPYTDDIFAGNKVVSFSDARPGRRGAANLPEASLNSAHLNELAIERQKAKSISFAEALKQVAQENPELTMPGGASAGAV